jgi:hypothetical protein
MLTDLIVGSVTEVDLVQRNTLGSLYVEPAGFGSDRDPAVLGSKADRGPRTWIYVYNDSGVSLVRGSVCVRKAATQTYNVRKSTFATPQNVNMVVGISDTTIATGSYGWIIREGMAEVLADAGGLTVDQAIVVGNNADGTADTIALAGTTVGFGFATEAALAAALATCWVSCQG